jgi:hypothetical protein
MSDATSERERRIAAHLPLARFVEEGALDDLA